MEKEKKDQFVIAYLPNIENNETVLTHAKYISQMLNKGLILLHICDPKYSTYSPEEAEKKLKELTTSPNINYCALKGETKEIIENLPTILSSVIIVTEVQPNAEKKSPYHPKTILKNFANCKTAWLTIQPNIKPQYENIAFTIDYSRESKEKYVWASYFTRFGNSKIHVLYQEYKDSDLRNLWYSNMLFLHKLYTNLQITFTPHPIKGKATSVDKDALPFIKENNYGLLVTTTTPNRSWLDQILDKAELKTIQNQEEIPVLFINPRKDLYILCD